MSEQQTQDSDADLRARIAADPDGSFGYHSRVSTAHRYVCITVPKIACSRIKLTLHLLEGCEPPEHVGAIHDMGRRLDDFPPGDVVEMLTAPGWFRFCFVRNPYDRLISAYATQVGNTWNQQYAWLKQEIREAAGYPEAGERERIVAFRDFVRYLREAREAVCRDGHFNLQTRVLMPDLVDYEVVGRFERFQDDFRAILRHLGAPPRVVATAEEVVNPTTKVQRPLVYDGALAAMAYELYAPDFETYGYARDSWMWAG